MRINEYTGNEKSTVLQGVPLLLAMLTLVSLTALSLPLLTLAEAAGSERRRECRPQEGASAPASRAAALSSA